MVYYANGGFNWHDVYLMPTKLREFYYNQIVEAKKAETEQINNTKNKTSKTSRR